MTKVVIEYEGVFDENDIDKVVYKRLREHNNGVPPQSAHTYHLSSRKITSVEYTSSDNFGDMKQSDLEEMLKDLQLKSVKVINK